MPRFGGSVYVGAKGLGPESRDSGWAQEGLPDA